MSKIQTNTIQHTANGAAVFTLPQTDGSSGQYMKTDGSGALSFGTVSSGGGGKILQVVQDFKGDEWSQSTSNNTSYYDITGLSQSITPTTSGNKILILVSLALGANQATQRMGVRTVVSVGGGSDTVIGNSTNGGTPQQVSIGNLEMHRVYHQLSVNYQFLYTTSSTSAHVFKPQVAMEASGTGTIYINRAEHNSGDSAFNSASTITLMEVAQ